MYNRCRIWYINMYGMDTACHGRKVLIQASAAKFYMGQITSKNIGSVGEELMKYF
jgi:hypothetical protein